MLWLPLSCLLLPPAQLCTTLRCAHWTASCSSAVAPWHWVLYSLQPHIWPVPILVKHTENCPLSTYWWCYSSSKAVRISQMPSMLLSVVPAILLEDSSIGPTWIQFFNCFWLSLLCILLLKHYSVIIRTLSLRFCLSSFLLSSPPSHLLSSSLALPLPPFFAPHLIFYVGTF